MLNILINWAIGYVLVMFAMCFDNYMWIPADYKWYGTGQWRKYFKVLFVFRGKEYIYPNTPEGWAVVRSRVKDVLTHQYDIIPALFTSFIIALFLALR